MDLDLLSTGRSEARSRLRIEKSSINVDVRSIVNNSRTLRAGYESLRYIFYNVTAEFDEIFTGCLYCLIIENLKIEIDLLLKKKTPKNIHYMQKNKTTTNRKTK